MSDAKLNMRHIRFTEATLANIKSLGETYHKTDTTLVREAVDIGVLVWAARQLPALRGRQEMYGPFDGATLARLLRIQLGPVIDFLIRHGELPGTSAPPTKK